ncbi:MAG: hypothetical protein LRY55_02385 [Leadbetterella sp.]|nr:hypothetical protein [Leadbetterella sp.]
MWIGRIDNPEPGRSLQKILEQTDPETAGIRHHVKISENAWAGFLHIPWDFIGADAEGNTGLNFTGSVQGFPIPAPTGNVMPTPAISCAGTVRFPVRNRLFTGLRGSGTLRWALQVPER